MRAKITKRVVDAAHPQQAAYLVRDTEIKGFVLVVTPAGAKSYAVDYRAGSGRVAPKRRLTIGKHGSPWTPEKARNDAKRLLAQVAAGGDPQAVREEERRALTFSELADLYLSEGAGHKKPSTLKSDRGRIEHHLRPLLGKLRADRISRAEIERMRDAVAAGKTAEKVTERRAGSIAKGGKGAAAQCVALVSTILGFAATRGLCTNNPARGVKKAPVRKVERFLSEAEIARLAAAIDAEAARSGNPYPAAAIQIADVDRLPSRRPVSVVPGSFQQRSMVRPNFCNSGRQTGATVERRSSVTGPNKAGACSRRATAMSRRSRGVTTPAGKAAVTRCSINTK
jgi:hypothetical protein